MDIDHEIPALQPEESFQVQPEEEVAASAVLTPPSIHHNDLIIGASYAHYTPIPKLVAFSSGTECVLGVDEAGRGPVLGPMVYGAFYLPIELHHSLLATKHHFDDSKVLTPAVRANLMKTTCSPGTDLYESCGWVVKSLSARDIGAGMMKNGGSYNLNAQAMDATIEIIRGVIDQGVNIREIYVDTIGTPAVYQKKLERIFPTRKVRVEKKADSLFPCVSAASVVAKVTRDVSCEILYEEFAKQAGLVRTAADGAAWGSGYPSDARCTAWLKSEIDPLFGWGSECRFSWGTVKDLLELKAMGATKADWPADQDDENMRMSDYFVAEGLSGEANNEAAQLRTWFGSSVGQEAF
jgi:ribonuclease H2 subunit A